MTPSSLNICANSVILRSMVRMSLWRDWTSERAVRAWVERVEVRRAWVKIWVFGSVNAALISVSVISGLTRCKY